MMVNVLNLKNALNMSLFLYLMYAGKCDKLDILPTMCVGKCSKLNNLQPLYDEQLTDRHIEVGGMV